MRKEEEIIRGRDELRKMQYIFAIEYIATGDARKAAEKAGYKNCDKTANRILRGVNVRKIIDEEMKKIQDSGKLFDERKECDVEEEQNSVGDYKKSDFYKSRIADAKEVIEYLSEVLRGEHINDNGSEKVNEKDRLKAAELLGKRYGIFSEKKEVQKDVPIIISGEEKLE